VLLTRRIVAEFVGTALLLVAVVGSGIAAQLLSTDDTGLQLLENSIATAVALVAIILAVGAVSGAHLNPLITLADRFFGGVTTREAGAYCGAQIAGAVVGTIVANLMFELPAVELSDQARSGGGVWLGEIVATFGLLLVVFGLVRSGRVALAPFAVAGWIGSAYFATSSTSFANPAVTVGRSLTDTFTGIEPASVPAFLVFQLVGAVLAVVVVRVLYPTVNDVAADVIVPHSGGSQSPARPATEVSS
jgi:glycerol uptake facilitator-like aquaporin